MPLLEAFSLDQLHRLFTFSRWILVVCGIIFLIFIIVNQYVAARISTLQDQEKKQAQQQLRASRAELTRTKTQTNELNAELSRFVAPRTLPDDQMQALQQCLSDGPRGSVVMSFLKTESDAEAYATQIANLLRD